MAKSDRDVRAIEAEALGLDASLRAALAKRLLASLDELSDEEYDRLWVEEAEARYADFVAGRTKAIDGDQVLANAYDRVRGR